MATTTNYGTFARHVRDSNADIRDYVETALGEAAPDHDIDGVVADFRHAINQELAGTGVELCGDDFVGPYPHTDVDLGEAIDRVDFWAVAAKNAKQLAELPFTHAQARQLHMRLVTVHVAEDEEKTGVGGEVHDRKRLCYLGDTQFFALLPANSTDPAKPEAVVFYHDVERLEVLS